MDESKIEEWTEAFWGDGKLADQISRTAKALLAEVEAERDELDGRFENLANRAEGYLSRAEAAEARLAAVLALCDEVSGSYQTGLPSFAQRVRAAAAGDRDV